MRYSGVIDFLTGTAGCGRSGCGFAIGEQTLDHIRETSSIRFGRSSKDTGLFETCAETISAVSPRRLPGDVSSDMVLPFTIRPPELYCDDADPGNAALVLRAAVS